MYLVESPLDRPDELSFCAAVPPESRGENVAVLPMTQALSIYHHGAYEELPAVAQRLLSAARERRLTPKGTLRRIYLEGPPQHKEARKFITQVALPIEDA